MPDRFMFHGYRPCLLLGLISLMKVHDARLAHSALPGLLRQMTLGDGVPYITETRLLTPEPFQPSPLYGLTLTGGGCQATFGCLTTVIYAIP